MDWSKPEALSVSGFCEIDKHAAAAYRAIYDTEGEDFYSDITKIDTGNLKDFDLLVGGFPCQPYPEKKNIPKNRKGAHSNGKIFRKIRDKILLTICYNYYGRHSLTK